MQVNVKPTILVADTDPAALSLSFQILRSDNYHLFAANCFESAISAARKWELDLILCDSTLWIGTPGKDLIAEIHRLPSRSDVPVIFTFGSDGPDVIRRQHDFGSAFHIKKPFDPIVLTELVERSLWMPHLVNTHIKSPHFSMTPTPAPALPIDSSIPAVNAMPAQIF